MQRRFFHMNLRLGLYTHTRKTRSCDALARPASSFQLFGSHPTASGLDQQELQRVPKNATCLGHSNVCACANMTLCDARAAARFCDSSEPTTHQEKQKLRKWTWDDFFWQKGQMHETISNFFGPRLCSGRWGTLNSHKVQPIEPLQQSENDAKHHDVVTSREHQIWVFISDVTLDCRSHGNQASCERKNFGQRTTRTRNQATHQQSLSLPAPNTNTQLRIPVCSNSLRSRTTSAAPKSMSVSDVGGQASKKVGSVAQRGARLRPRRNLPVPRGR